MLLPIEPKSKTYAFKLIRTRLAIFWCSRPIKSQTQEAKSESGVRWVKIIRKRVHEGSFLGGREYVYDYVYTVTINY